MGDAARPRLAFQCCAFHSEAAIEKALAKTFRERFEFYLNDFRD
jgi:hypothetical protein